MDDHETHPRNGIAAELLTTARWRKAARSNPTGCCVELAELPDGRLAMRNSRFPSGPALIYGRAAIAAVVQAARNGGLAALGPRYGEGAPAGDGDP
ncbi:MAG TPA: DUF397 domain-containing protein [Trebonia sp.]|nr:DUF397 domain-containing protein [Trebonia sp.]